ncbi:MAG: SLC13 family permease [Candidatus Fermentibacterota bacterium]
MSPDQLGTFVILGVAVILFLSERLRPEVIALMVLSALAASGILTAPEAFSGFSSRAVMILISVFIIAEGLTRTGVSDAVAGLLLRWGGRGEGRLVTVVMAAGAGLSLFLNNIASAAVLLPAVGTAAGRADVPPSKVLMPLVYATILGGMATLLTTMNIVVSSVLEKSGLQGYGLLDFLPIGIPVVVAGMLYMGLVGRHRLRDTGSPAPGVRSGGRGRLLDIYRMASDCFRARIPAGSELEGERLSDSRLREEQGVDVVAIERSDGSLAPLDPDTRLLRGDRLLLRGDMDEFQKLDTEPLFDLEPCDALDRREVQARSTVIAEAMLSPRSSLTGSTLRDVEFRQEYGFNVLAIWRKGEPLEVVTGEERLAFGDALLLQGPREGLERIERSRDLILLSMESRRRRRLGPMALAAVGILVATLVTVIATPLPIAQVLLAGAVLMLLAGAVSPEQAYRAIDWGGVFLIAGMLPLALAMRDTGAAETISTGLLDMFGSASPLLLVLGLFMTAALLTQAVSGAAVAAIMAPIAISAAESSGVPARALGMAVALGSSMAFITPLGHPVNILVMGAGGYRFSDYRRVGLPLFLILTVVIVSGIVLRWSLL